jgi:hypothetical protein
MLQPIDRASWSRFLALAALLTALCACGTRGGVRSGHVEVRVSGDCDGARDGQLRLEGAWTTVISGGELCQGPFVRELPAGLYSLSWRGSTLDNGMMASASPPLRGPALVGVLAGRTTRLQLTLESPPSPALSSETGAGDGTIGGPTTCSQLAHRAGPS